MQIIRYANYSPASSIATATATVIIGNAKLSSICGGHMDVTHFKLTK